MSDYDDDNAYDTCDTDTISLTSTIPSDAEEEYNVEAILSDERNRDDGTMKYLVKWLEYAWHRQVSHDDCTWEPPENLDGTALLEEWVDKRRTMGNTAFREMKQSNKARFKRAERKARMAKARRKEKRDKKRRKQKRQAKRSVPFDDDSEDDLPLVRQKGATQAKARSLKSSKQKDESAAGSFDSLFVDSQESLSPRTGLSPLARRPPLYQSSSEDSSSSSDAHSPQDLLLGNTQERNPGATVKSSKHGESDQNVQRSEQETNLQCRDSVKTTLVPPKTAPGVDNNNNKSNAKDSHQVTTPASQTTASIQRKASGVADDVALKSITKGVVREVGKPTTTAAPRVATIRSSVAGPRPSGIGIKMVNQPKTQTRKEWSSDKLYGKLRYRGLADKKSCSEAMPDFSALEIVHGPSIATAKPKLPVANENPYGRRETINRRVREAGPDDDLPRRGSTDDSAPFEKWEEGKIPLVCPHWRLSRNCIHGNLNCRFLHRDKDDFGRDIKIAPADGSVPAKYRNPPLTCPFWLKGHCKKPNDECSYAHRNTGWGPPENRSGEPVRLDPDHVPLSVQHAHDNPRFNKGKQKLPSHQVTCWYWKHGRCRNTSEDCDFQHLDTGTIADPPANITVKTKICRDWQNGTCSFNAERCRFRHDWTDTDQGLPFSEHDSVNTIPVQRRQTGGFEQTPAADSGPAIDHEMIDPTGNVDDMDTINAQHASPTTGQSTQMVISQPSQHARLIEQPPVDMLCLQVKQKIEQACKLDFADMFTGNRDGSAMVDRRAFLLYHPQDHAEELDLVTRWLLMHHVEVGDAWYDGSWDHFRQQIMQGGTGVVIAHPDFEYFSDLPDFGQVLKSDVRLWSIGLQPGLEYDPTASDLLPELGYNRIEIFPIGGFIYITDEVFEKKPQLALKIVELFFAMIRKLRDVAGPITPWHEVDDAAVFWRLCVRPELMQYLWQTCEKHDAELQAGDPEHLSRAKLYELLNETNWIEQDEPLVPLSMIQDKYPILSERYDVAKEEPVDYFNTLARSQEEANLRMIQYYVGLLVDMRRDYRHFYVVHTDPSAPCVQAWKAIQNIADVMTPEQLIEELGKPGKESKIDFYEWAMPKYEVNN